MLSDMVTEGVPQKGVSSQYATTEKRNPLWVEGPVKESDRFLVWTWRCRNGRGAAFDKWEFGLTQLLDALGADPEFINTPPPDIATPQQLTRETQAAVHQQAAALARFQHINTALHYHVLASLDLSGSSELHDQRALHKHVSRGKADGIATVKWALKFADVTGIEKQAELLSKFKSMQLSAGASCVDLHKHINSLFEVWRLLDGSDVDQPLGFYRQLMVSMPTQPQASHIVSTRTYFALQVQQYMNGTMLPELQNVVDFADVMVKHARTIGLPEGAQTMRC